MVVNHFLMAGLIFWGKKGGGWHQRDFPGKKSYDIIFGFSFNRTFQVPKMEVLTYISCM